MATSLQMKFLPHLLQQKIVVLIQILKYAPSGPVDNKPALIKIMAWHQKGNKPFSEPMIA